MLHFKANLSNKPPFITLHGTLAIGNGEIGTFKD